MTARGKILRRKISSGEAAYVFNVRFARTADIVSLAAASGPDGFYVDFQHGAISLETAAQIWAAALHSHVTAYMRVPLLDPGFIAAALDAGSQGVMAADIRTPDQARQLVRTALLPPLGDRSVGGTFADPRVTAASAKERNDQVNGATLLVPMLESEAAIEAAGEIAEVAGIDALQIGTNDLSTSMGLPGQLGHDRVRAACGRAIEACRRIGKPLIIGGVREKALLEEYVRMGAARCYFTGIDAGFLLDGATRAAANAREVEAAFQV